MRGKGTAQMFGSSCIRDHVNVLVKTSMHESTARAILKIQNHHWGSLGLPKIKLPGEKVKNFHPIKSLGHRKQKFCPLENEYGYTLSTLLGSWSRLRVGPAWTYMYCPRTPNGTPRISEGRFKDDPHLALPKAPFGLYKRIFSVLEFC